MHRLELDNNNDPSKGNIGERWTKRLIRKFGTHFYNYGRRGTVSYMMVNITQRKTENGRGLKHEYTTASPRKTKSKSMIARKYSTKSRTNL
jgi:hypothetical protein